MVTKHGLNIKQLSLKTLVPLIEYSSLEEDETLQEKWVNLIVNFIDAEQRYESSVFPWILNQLSTSEVQELEKLYQSKRITRARLIEAGIEAANLTRLGLIEQHVPTVVYFYEEGEEPANVYEITSFGKRFVDCCSPRQ